MSLNEYQQDKVNQLLKTDFKKQYDLIPKEYKHNYYFERFLFATADINAMIEFSIQHLKEAKKHSDFDISFETRKHNDDLITFVKYITTDGLRTEKRSMQVQLGKDGTLAFHGIFDFIYKEKNRNDTSVIYDLEMSLNEDKSKVLVTYSTLGKYPQAPCKCFLFSVFEPNGNELSRIAEALNFKTQETVFHEEFLPAGSINFNDLSIYQQKGEGNDEILK